MRVGGFDAFEPGECGDQHKQGRTRQVEIGQQHVDRVEAVAGRQRGLTPPDALPSSVGVPDRVVDGGRAAAQVQVPDHDLGVTVVVGRGAEAGNLLEEAQNIARELKNESANSDLYNAQGDVAFYRGDLKAARAAYLQALSSATKSKDREKIVVAKLNLARLGIAEGRAASVISELRADTKDADSLHLKALSVRTSVNLGEALLKTKDYANARKELENALSRSERLGLRFQTAQIHYLLGEALTHTGANSEAANHYQQARSILDAIKQEPQADHLLDRPDIRSMYNQASQAVVASK